MSAYMMQLAKDLQALVAGAVAVEGAKAFEGEAPRDGGGVVLFDEMPFVVYTVSQHSPQDESGVWTLDVFIDVWALNGWENAYKVAAALDDLLDGTVHETAAGVLCCDRNGLVMQRADRDPTDERIRRMSGQYLIRFYPNN